MDRLDIIKIVLTGLYGSLSLLALIQFIRVLRVAQGVNNRVLLQFLLFFAPLVRCVLMAIPPKIYSHDIFKHKWLQVSLDLFPELLFWQSYVALVLIWAELYHFARSLKTFNIDRSMFITFCIISAFAYTCAAVFAAWMNERKYTLLPEAFFLAFLTSAAILVFGVYGFLLYRSMKRVPFFPAVRKKKMLTKVKVIVFVVILCNILHVVYLFMVDDVFNFDRVRPSTYVMIWAAYLTGTEFLPSLAVFILFRKPPKKKVQYVEIPAGPPDSLPRGPVNNNDPEAHQTSIRSIA